MSLSFRANAVALATIALVASQAAHATNGMNMEGYGPIATGMGGAATAYDNGTAGMANNPATLQLAPNGHRVDGAIGILQPNITAQAMAGAPAQASTATSFVMPAIGWTSTNDQMTWGVGMFAQGGMGAEYPGSTPLSAMTAGAVRSELGVGRVIFPVAYRVTPKLTIGGSLDYVWAGLDMKMAANGTQVEEMLYATGASKAEVDQVLTNFGMYDAGANGGNGGGDANVIARLEFSDNSTFTGAAKGTGLGTKVGATFQASDTLTLGVSYHGKTKLSDMETSATGATFGGAPGKITVVDFQWPAITSVGAAWIANPKLTLAMDVKRIAWSDVMSSFNMQFLMSGAPQPVSFAMPQNWKDQTVTMLGASYQLNEQTTLRGGLNLASNPVPEMMTHPLFPATVKSHYTFGVGHQIDKSSSIDLSATIAPQVSITSRYLGVITHSQTNFQLMYSYRY